MEARRRPVGVLGLSLDVCGREEQRGLLEQRLGISRCMCVCVRENACVRVCASVCVPKLSETKR